jgi:DNA-binding GntR family transcriptional regulator
VHQTGQLHAAVLEHRTLLQQIVAGNGELAALTMRVHVDDFEHAMRDALLQS